MISFFIALLAVTATGALSEKVLEDASAISDGAPHSCDPILVFVALDSKAEPHVILSSVSALTINALLLF
jgi:hypothetical protein